ncbi:EscU/YscU/HrcU family type III secretion system export apparatus switch protein [Clostridiaceae bacterium HSG29]|nr:EscU/YscU/HrcU family type III secretion system export apparatus switch protein [Clostridiaceae bacterium HSG29]
MNKEIIANALKYDEDDVAPKVVAKGRGHIAKKIIETAKENNISVYKDEKLAKQLENLNLGQAIPSELYEVVAEILIYIAKIDS